MVAATAASPVIAAVLAGPATSATIAIHSGDYAFYMKCAGDPLHSVCSAMEKGGR